MAPLAKRFGNLVAANRRRLGWTQANLAEQAGLSVDMVAKMETGSASPSFRTLELLAGSMSIDVAELFTTELKTGAASRAALTDVSARISGLSDSDLRWLSTVLDAVLKPRG